MTVDVPAGIADGQRVRIGGRGHVGEPGARAGDLYVLIRVRDDERFVREGDDLITAARRAGAAGRTRRELRGADAGRAGDRRDRRRAPSPER